MKPYQYMILVVLSLIIGGMALNAYLAQPLEVIKEVPTEVYPDWVDPENEEAQKAYEDVVRRQALEAELEVLNKDIEELQTRRDSVEKELGIY